MGFEMAYLAMRSHCQSSLVEPKKIYIYIRCDVRVGSSYLTLVSFLLSEVIARPLLSEIYITDIAGAHGLFSPSKINSELRRCGIEL